MKRGLTVLQHEGSVVLELDGKYLCDMPWQVALELAQAVVTVAKRAEEHSQAGRIITQDALLIRSGAPFSLTNNRELRAAAYHRAQWDRDLRRMPIRGVPSPREVGVPRIKKGRVH